MADNRQQQPQQSLQISEAKLVDLFTKYEVEMKKLLPKHLSVQRMFYITQKAVTRSPKLLECTPASVLGSLMQCAQLGLEPDGLTGQAYLVPFRNTTINKLICQLIPGYQGLMDLARRSRRVTGFDAQAVYEGDTFEWAYGTEPYLKFIPKSGRKVLEDAALTHTYALCYEDGKPKFKVCDRAEIAFYQSKSKARNDDNPWKNFFAAMARKTAVRRLCTYVPRSTELATALGLDDLVDAGLPQNLDTQWVPHLIGPGEAEPTVDAHAADEGAAAPAEYQNKSNGGPYPSAVLQLGIKQGFSQAQVLEFAATLLNKELANISEIAKGAECQKVLDELATARPPVGATSGK